MIPITIGSVSEWIDAFQAELRNRFNPGITLMPIYKDTSLSVDNIIYIVSELTDVPLKLFNSPHRGEQRITEARQAAIYATYKYLNMSKSDIARRFNRDHSSVINSLKVINNRLSINDEQTIALLNAIDRRITHLLKQLNNETKVNGC
ncbi:MAG: hypothetical protein IT249_19970 [Chitinophagaceae bacterium]|nr:hypothetical protein [Chitinophagaceae bacterium]